MKQYSIYILLLLAYSCTPEDSADYTLIKGATLIDVNELGHSDNDIDNAYILLKNGKIEAFGAFDDKVNIPKTSQIIDATGKFMMPALFDGFAALNKQSYCDAYLQSGVANIISVDGGRRGIFFGDGNPSPNIYRLEGIGDESITDEVMLGQIDSLHSAGYKVLLLMYGLTPKQVAMAQKRADELEMATIGEMATTTYKEAMEIGIDAFVHTTRYSLDVAPREVAAAIAKEPFSNDLNSPKWQYYKYLSTLPADDKALQNHAQNLGASSSFIIPTSSLSYLDLPDHKNPWKEDVARLLKIEDINRPADPETGNHSIDSVEQAAYTNLIMNELKSIEPTYHYHGAKYLAGSGTDVWGTMPGISLHTELWILHNKIGLSKREALAAATSNFSAAFGWKNGKIEKGFDGNILILNANPLEDLENLKGIDRMLLNGVVLGLPGGN